MAKRPAGEGDTPDDGGEPTLLYLVGRVDRVVRQLEQRGLVQRHAHPEHGRVLQTRLTAKGRTLLANCDAEVRQVEARMVSCLSDDDRAGFRTTLVQCIHSLRGGLEKEKGTSRGSRAAGAERQGTGDAGGVGGRRPG